MGCLLKKPSRMTNLPNNFKCLLVVLGCILTSQSLLIAGNRLFSRKGFMRSIFNKKSTEEVESSGMQTARSPSRNKAQSFAESEREALHLHGLFPSGDPMSLETKVKISLDQVRHKSSPLEKYIYLHTLQDADETLYYRLLVDNLRELLPVVYTPTVGDACLQWGRIYRHTPRGCYLSQRHKGRVLEVLRNQPQRDVKVIVVTDGERILGLGDQGLNGMGIPIGKLALYTACAGIHPDHCLPVHIDVGTDRVAYQTDESYMGLRQNRVRGREYFELLAEFMEAVKQLYGETTLVQFEDFGNHNAFELLELHKDNYCCFNDDIQGTASVVLAGIIASLPLVNKSKVSEHTFLFYGAGEAGVGIANQITRFIMKETGWTAEEARKKIWLVDSQGMIHSQRGDSLAAHKAPYAHDVTPEMKLRDICSAAFNVSVCDNDIVDDHQLPICTNSSHLWEAIQTVQPTALIGVSAQPGAFDKGICRLMASIQEHPLIFALSNPTSKAEITAEHCYNWTDGKAVFASGSPFDRVILDGRIFEPGQGNNAYIFPGVGLAAVVSEALRITDEDFSTAAEALAALVSPSQLAVGCMYPKIDDIREVSVKIAARVARGILASGRSKRSGAIAAAVAQPESQQQLRGGTPRTAETVKGVPSVEELEQECRQKMYYPTYN